MDRLFRTSFSVLLLLLLTAPLALAKDNGKTGRTSLSSSGCGSCHASGANTAVIVSVSGHTSPITVEPGASVDLTVVVAHATAKVAGIDIDVATSPTGTAVGTLTPGAGLKLVGTELVHSSPRSMVGGSASFAFTWTAPSQSGTYTLRAVALAANGNGGDDNNDVWNRLPDFQITVQGTPPPPPDPGSITVTNPTGGERYHPGDTVNITWNATAPIVRIPSIRGLKKTEQAQSEDDEAEDESDDESDDDSDDESDDDSDDDGDDDSDDESDDDSDDDGDDDSDDDGDDDSDDDDSSDDSDSTGTGGGTGGGSGGNDSTGTGGGTGGGTDTTAAGNFVQIEWSSTGSQGPWNLLADSVAMNDERFRWIVPNILTEDAWVKITRVDIDTVYGMNPAAFAIVAEDSSSGGGGSDTTGGVGGGGGDDSTQVAGIVIAHPAENEIVPTGAAYLITWTSRASQLVNLQWDQCGEGWSTIAEGVQAAKGRHLWNVPLHADGDARVRVVDAANTTDVLEVSKTFQLRSSTTDVNDDMTSMTVQLAPQPVTAGDDLQVRLGSVGASTVTLWSITGAPVYGPATNTGEHFAITIPNALSAGAYLLTIEGAGRTQRLPVFINR